ncbi:hypothetical protein L596_023582 [Steinernema carpocapsae]|uniref:Uncharacterized protein n=1 Tax=Steinernema carpocapsae TaxID=34508 RepID=A0A4U5ME19_STECR|nr:hypothetical protein L596_023582 [Steinernema carpocapsae]
MRLPSSLILWIGCFLVLSDLALAWNFNFKRYPNPNVTPEKMANIEKAKMTEKQFKNVERLHMSWYAGAVSGLLGAVGKELFEKMDKRSKDAFIQCLDVIDDDGDLTSSAKCLTKAIDKRLLSVVKEKKDFEFTNDVRQSDWVGGFRVSTPAPTFKELVTTLKPLRRVSIKKEKEENPIVEAKERVERRRNRLSKFFKNPDTVMSSMHFRAKRSANNFVDKETAFIEDKRDRPVKTMSQLNSLADPSISKPPSAIKQVSTFLTNLVHAIDKNNGRVSSWDDAYKQLQELKGMVEETRQMSKYRYRVLDIVLGENNAYRKKKTISQRIKGFMPEEKKGMPMLEETYKLVDALSKNNQDLNYKFLSPKFASVLPSDNKETRNLFSPNILPFYNDESPNSIMPVPKILDAMGMDEDDKHSVLGLIMEASGARQIADEAFSIMKDAKMFGIDNDIINVTHFITETFQKMERSMTTRQKRQIDTKKYTFLKRHQLEMIYGEKGAYNTNLTEFPIDLDDYETWTEVDKREALYGAIRDLAGEPQPTTGRRGKRHTTLAPYAFAPTVVAPVILGPITLSPSIFSPNIFSPLIVSPPVISPQVGNPLIFSPYVLGPNVLSAAVFNVYVFAPYVLSPNVINPYVMSPLILSPHVLCPDVLSPTILSGAILNPYVGSPAVFTESALAADVLSPSFLS